MGQFRIIYADPPWRFKNWSMAQLSQRGEKWARRNGRSPYPVMTIDDICNLPVKSAKDSLLLMWATSPKIADGSAHKVMHAWGFEPVTIGFDWIKLNPSGIGWHFGLGYHTHQNAEYVFIAKRGKGVSRVDKGVSSLVIYPRGKHSAKPPEVRDRIIRLYGDVPRCELFARNTHPEFATWGNEVPIDDRFGELNNYIAPPYTTIVDEDEWLGLPVMDTDYQYSDGEQMRML